MEDDREVYTGFASVYDELMDNVPYDEWVKCYHRILKEHGIDEGLICDLACGTGNITTRLRDLGYDMIGVEISEEMLDLARRKDPEGKILFLLQDMCAFELYGTVRACTLACDSINYLLEEEELLELFLKVNNYLDPEGVFIFDFNTTEKYRDIIGNTTIAENREDCSFIWDNAFDEESGINECELTVFTRKGKEGLFERLSEMHLQRGYEPKLIQSLIEQAGMVEEKIMTMEEAGLPEDPGRMLVIAREKGKSQENK
ncbi:MAG: class I SAM-dependent methyltransferase [Lachnospiraceae bacterium]|nr:class I SAM-dependent methyltransferase [Lachnospiraceae bacterium]